MAIGIFYQQGRIMQSQTVTNQPVECCCTRLLSRTLAVALLAAVPAVALAGLGVSFSLSMLANARGAAPADSLMPAPAAEVRSIPVAGTGNDDLGVAVLNNWTYTRRPISISH
jgi:hypothetical protein